MSRSTLLRAAVIAPVAAALYLVAWPTDIKPVAWHPLPAPQLAGRYAPNDRLSGVEWIGRGQLPGPEAVALDPKGRVWSGTRDGRVVRYDPATRALETVVETGGRPLGLAFDPPGTTLYICDALEGLLAFKEPDGLRTLATEHDGVRFGFTDDVDVGHDGTVYFTDASSRFGPDQYREDILEHGGHGRLLAYDPGSSRTTLLLDGLQFANGVAVAGDGSFVAVNETGAYRVLRYWLTGPRRGTAEPLIENLPGFPDNVTWSPERKVFWVALFSPRLGAVDGLAGHPFLRKVVMRLPSWVQPRPAHVAWVLAVDAHGRVVETLEDRGPGAFAPVTSARERDGVLWLGSLTSDGFARIAAPPLAAQ